MFSAIFRLRSVCLRDGHGAWGGDGPFLRCMEIIKQVDAYV